MDSIHVLLCNNTLCQSSVLNRKNAASQMGTTVFIFSKPSLHNKMVALYFITEEHSIRGKESMSMFKSILLRFNQRNG
jgi:hypothetical protein